MSETTRYTLFVTWPACPPARETRDAVRRPDGTCEEQQTYSHRGYADEWAEFYRAAGAEVRILPH